MNDDGPYDWREDEHEDETEPADWRVSMAIGVVLVAVVALLMTVR